MDTFVTPMLEHLHPCFLYLLFTGGTPNNAEKATTFRNISMGDFMKLGEMIKKQEKMANNWRLFG